MKTEYEGYTGVWRRLKSGAAIFIRDGEDIKKAVRRNFNSGQKYEDRLNSIAKADDEAFEKEQKARGTRFKAFQEKGELSEEYVIADKDVKSAKDEQNRLRNERYKVEDERQQTRYRNEFGIKVKQEQVDKLKQTGQVKKSLSDWREQIKKNNEETQKATLELEKQRQNEYYRFRQDEWADKYYGTFRENERRNAKIKQELPDEKYEYVDSYATYKDKFDNYGDNDIWTGKVYTNDEFMEHLTDANWHTERRMLEDANLTNAQLTYIKDRVKLGKWSADLDKAKTEKLINEAKQYKATEAEVSRTPKQRAAAIDDANYNGNTAKLLEYSDYKLKKMYNESNNKKLKDDIAWVLRNERGYKKFGK